MGDIVGLVKDFEGVVDAEKAEEDAMRMLKGKFDMQDFLDQIRMIPKNGFAQGPVRKTPFLLGWDARPASISMMASWSKSKR